MKGRRVKRSRVKGRRVKVGRRSEGAEFRSVKKIVKVQWRVEFTAEQRSVSSLSITYVSYDRFPSRKGAGVHIDAFTRSLADAFGPLDLLTVHSDPTAEPEPPRALGPSIRHHPLPARGGNLIQRVQDFRRELALRLEGRQSDVIHFRSIFEGYPIAIRKQQMCRQLVYEVNGLPSIELKYHYPDVADDRELLAKLRGQEQVCLDAADLVVTVSDVNARHLEGRGVPSRRIRVIPNGVDPLQFRFQRPRHWDDREIRMLYSGTMSAWQGVLVAIEALALVRREMPARMTLVGDARQRQIRQIRRRCESLQLTEFVDILPAVSQTRLARLHHEADVVLAPLKANDRNLVQGCCPLKVLEAMASGTPLIASDLPVVSALARGGREATLVRPGSAKAIKDAVLRLRDDPHHGRQMAAAARRRILQQFRWEHSQRRLVRAYEEVLGMTSAKTTSKQRDSRAG